MKNFVFKDGKSISSFIETFVSKTSIEDMSHPFLPSGFLKEKDFVMKNSIIRKIRLVIFCQKKCISAILKSSSSRPKNQNSSPGDSTSDFEKRTAFSKMKIVVFIFCPEV